MMHSSQWRLQDAKTQFSQVVEAALQGEPQHVTRRGREAVVEGIKGASFAFFLDQPCHVAHALN